MANTFTQLYVHFVFAVQDRFCIIRPEWKRDLYAYMGGIIKQHGHQPYAINGMPDHAHALVSMSPKQAPSDLMYHVKRGSSLWINENRLVAGKFAWQEGFGAFSYGKSQIPRIVTYIEKQEEHHAKRSFIEEYLSFLKMFGVVYDERYIFKPVEPLK